MTETEWANENPAPSKKIVPTWLWFCGGGCLLAVILGVFVVMWGVGMAKEAIDPDVQYASLEEHIGLDERPEEWTLLFGMPIGIDMWTFQDSRGYAVIIMHFGASDAEEVRGQMFDPEVSGGVGGMGDRKGMELSKITVQGREVDMMTYYQQGGGQNGGNSGQSASVDITGEGEAGLLFMILTRMSGDEPISEEEVNEVLAPFHVGPER